MRFLKRDKTQQSISVGEFAHEHKDLIIIVADPVDDTIFVAYKDRFASGRIKTTDGKNARILRDMMSNAFLFDRQIDRFLYALMEIMRVKRLSRGVNNFLQFLDGALYNISMKHRVKQSSAGSGQPSPLQPDADGRLPGVEDLTS